MGSLGLKLKFFNQSDLLVKLNGSSGSNLYIAIIILNIRINFYYYLKIPRVKPKLF